MNDKWMSVIQIVPTQISRTTWKQTVIRLKDLISNQIDRSECNPPKRGRWVGSDDLEAQRQIVGTCSSVTVPAPMADTVNQSLHTFNDEFWRSLSIHPIQYSRQRLSICQSYYMKWNLICQIWPWGMMSPSHGSPLSATNQRTLH